MLCHSAQHRGASSVPLRCHWCSSRECWCERGGDSPQERPAHGSVPHPVTATPSLRGEKQLGAARGLRRGDGLKSENPEQTRAWGRDGAGGAGALPLGTGGCSELRAGTGAGHGALLLLGSGAAPSTTSRCGSAEPRPGGGAAAALPPLPAEVGGSRRRKCPSAAGCPCPARIHLLPEEPPGRVPGPGVGPRVPPPSHSFGAGSPPGRPGHCLRFMGAPALLAPQGASRSPGGGGRKGTYVATRGAEGL